MIFLLVNHWKFEVITISLIDDIRKTYKNFYRTKNVYKKCM